MVFARFPVRIEPITGNRAGRGLCPRASTAHNLGRCQIPRAKGGTNDPGRHPCTILPQPRHRGQLASFAPPPAGREQGARRRSSPTPRPSTSSTRSSARPACRARSPTSGASTSRRSSSAPGRRHAAGHRVAALPLAPAVLQVAGAEGEIRESPMATMKPPHVPESRRRSCARTTAAAARAVRRHRLRGPPGHRDHAPAPRHRDAPRRARRAAARRHRFDHEAAVVHGQGPPAAGLPVRPQDRPGPRPLPPRPRAREPTRASRVAVARQARPADRHRHRAGRQAPRPRGRAARIHPHLFRHTYAHQWLADGGTRAT